MKYFLAFLISGFIFTAQAQTIVGKWKMVGMKSGKERSVIQMYEKNDRYYGKVVKLYPIPGADPNPKCDVCEDGRKGQPIIGMDIITDLEYNSRSGEYKGGKILDPKSGSEYDCKVWLGNDGYLRVRGYLFFVGKTYILPQYTETQKNG